MTVRKTSAETAEHYLWADTCDGWRLLKDPDISVIQERVPPGKSEVRHYHNVSRQFFFVLDGEATIDIGTEVIRLGSREGIEIPPTVAHQFRNETSSDVVFLVISSPASHGDRIELLD